MRGEEEEEQEEIARLDGPFQQGVSGWAKQRGYLGGSPDDLQVVITQDRIYVEKVR